MNSKLMKSLFRIFLLSLFLASCAPNEGGSLSVTGNVEGLKKGTLYLQKFVDTVLVSVDSVQLQGSGAFEFSDALVSPEIYYVVLKELPREPITIFAEAGEIRVETRLDRFSTGAVVTGSRNHDLLEEHYDMTQRFNGQQLDFVKARFEAQQANDTALVSKIDADEVNLLKRKMLFTTNFAVNHADAEVAPYLALTELYYANLELLDTINRSLTDAVKTSKYGLELEKLIKGIEKEDQE
jgi:hypothetical protein